MDSKIVSRDVDRMIESMRFYDVARYRNDPPWAAENKLQDDIESKKFRRLESDAEHSWHLADLVLLLGPHWPELDLGKATQMAVLHDKVEIFTGDDLAIGMSGNGTDSHAFNAELKKKRQIREAKAWGQYLRSLTPSARKFQSKVFSDYQAKTLPEARFVDALDKIDVLVWILFGKTGQANPYARNHRNWYEFAETYHRARVAKFPGLMPYFDELLRRIKKSD